MRAERVVMGMSGRFGDPLGELAAGQDVTSARDPFMCRSISLAQGGRGRTNPNPQVGAVVVRDGHVIGEGYHERFGHAHAERNALADCARRGEDPRGATLYVTLEPCCHQGHQPPCTDAIVEAGVARVVVGSRDPNPLVSGGGVSRLREAGVEVVQDVMRAECDAINQPFFHFITTGRPYLVAKWAMTADGRIACSTGDSRWVSGEASRSDAHALRGRLAAVMVGVGTVLADDPLLTCRVPGGRNPVRVVCDTRLRTPADCALVRTAGEAPVLVACGSDVLSRDERVAERARCLTARGVEVLPVATGRDGHVDLAPLLSALGDRGIDSVLLEGGSALLGSAFAAGLVNEAVAYVAPKVVGGAEAPGPVGGAGVARMADALRLGPARVRTVGEDVRICWRVGATDEQRALPCVACEDDVARGW